MKKFLIVLAVVGSILMGCKMGVSDNLDGPTAALQGTWYLLGNYGPTNKGFLEFKGNTMREYYPDWKGRITDNSGTFTTNGTVITVIMLIEDLWHYDNGDEPFYMTLTTPPYTIGERTIHGVNYPNVLTFGGSSQNDFLGEGIFIKLDTPPQ